MRLMLMYMTLQVKMSEMYLASLLTNYSGGVKLLVQTALTVLPGPLEAHRVAKYVRWQEKKIHESAEVWRGCIQQKLGKDLAQVLVRCMDPPGLLERVGFKMSEAFNWVFLSSTTRRMERWRVGAVCAVKGFLPNLQVFLFLLDQIKDLFLFGFLCLSFHHVTSDLLRGLIVFQGFSVISSLSGLVWIVQTSKAIVNLDHMREPVRKVVLRLLLLLATPLLPVIITLRLLKLQVAHQTLVANWRIRPTRSNTISINLIQA